MTLVHGGLAQLGERLHGMQEVTGSIPVFSTKKALYFVGSMVLFFLLKPVFGGCIASPAPFSGFCRRFLYNPQLLTLHHFQKRIVLSCKKDGIMVLCSWKKKAGGPMPENKTQQELDFERKHEQDLQRLRGLRLIDDDFMAAVFEDPACAEFLLQIILKREDLKVREVHGQYSIKNLQGRSVRLDILAVDEQNRAYNIEVQRSDRGASEKRARYNSSLLDANLTHSGSSYDALNEAYVIFITENDVLKAGLPIYHIHRRVEETGAVFNDQSHIIYVNSQIKDESALGKLMHDFFCTDAKDMFYPVLANRVQYFKQDAKGVATMCRAMEEMRNETVRERNIECALEMLADGMPYEKVAKYSKLTLEEVKALDTKKPA